ncbi:MAG TPA: DoxX family protein [Chryseosolibacter sp.]|nr:DoxX family protein [Chryseosolibacter sp.]
MKTNTTFDWSLLLARIVLGIVIAAHGAQKLLGWFGGYGFDGTVNFFTEVIGLPFIFAALIILAESIGMIALVFGLMSRLISISLVAIMLGAIITTHAQHGFFMNWFGVQAGEGIEFHLLVIALSAVIALNGAGAFSIDATFGQHVTKIRHLRILFR